MFMDVAFLVHFLDVPFLFLPSLILLFGTAGLNLLIAIMLFLSQIYINDDFKQWIRLNSRVATLFTILSIFHIEVLKVLTSNFLHSETFNAPISNSARKWLSITGLFLVVVEDVPQFVILVSTAFQGSRKNFYVKIINNVVCELYKPINRSNTQNIQLSWNKKKLRILWNILNGLETIHNKELIHRDVHSGNILFVEQNNYRYQWQIGDLGLSQPANNTSLNNEIYGVIPYIAPEIFNGAPFSKKSDVYSVGMIMWELTTGCKPFSNVEHDHVLIYEIIDGKRPEITNDTPECYVDLMKRCWDSDPSKRSSIKVIRQTVGSWLYRKKNDDLFDQAEKKRVKLMNLKKLGPKLIEKHPNAIYTSRALSSLISRPLNLSANSFNGALEYISKEYEFDMDTRGLLAINAQPSNVMSTENSSKKRSIKELEAKTQVYQKQIKTSSESKISLNFYNSISEL
ncbi:1243_t:CDS:2 [Funneliformis geosporum]|nr:1243_t:CDS:2 [Funneliformis geosporum]